MQDVGMEYLKAGSYNITGLHEPATAKDSIQFYTMRMNWEDTGRRWEFVPDKIIGSDLEGVRKILSGSASDEYITLERFFDNIRRRLNLT